MRKNYVWKECLDLPKEFGLKYIHDYASIVHLIQAFIREYRSIRLYHLCRPIDIESYRVSGIQVGSRELLKSLVRNILEVLSIELTDREISEVVEAYEYQSGCLYLALDDEFMLQWAGHYAIYGSERLIAVIERLGIPKEKLTTVGTPTIIQVDLPIEKISEEDLSSFLIELNNSTVEGFEQVDFAFMLSESVKPEFIAGFSYPDEIINPLEGRAVYKVCN